MIYLIDPVAKPRMTRSDKWKKRPCVLKYWDFCDAVRDLNIEIPVPAKVTFYIKPAESWSNKKKLNHYDKPHTDTPDVDNLLKGLLDAVYDDDKHIWSIWAEKRWAKHGAIEVEAL